jgi:tetratricopeptide (TPR) repeat protein
MQLSLFVVALALMLCGPEGLRAQDRAESVELDELYSQLAEPEREDWERVEREITRIWSRSGSSSMDLLLRRGNEALENENYEAALEHFSALVDHAPEFAEGWNARATAYFMLGEYTLSLADVEHVLVLNPRHFGALAGLGFMLEQMGETEMALEALREAHDLNPHRENVTQSISRLERQLGQAEL